MEETFAPLRLWLEPGYDEGRFGVWLLDLPGAFGWARSEALARSQSPSVAGRFREWLAAHGEPFPIPSLKGAEIVESVAPTRHDDGTERNATFAHDRRPVSAEEVATTLRHLGHARADLLALLDRLRAHERTTAPLPADPAREGDRGQRTSEEVLRHLAGSEVWLASRLGADVRYAGPHPHRGPLDEVLAATRAYVVERLPALQRADPGERTDSKGETWTLAKVCRRLVYHALDHLWELDRRLARADGTAAGIVTTLERRPEPEQLRALLRSVGWDPRAVDLEQLRGQIAGSTEVASAWDGERLVGFARSSTDRVSVAYLSTVVVHPRYQGLGVGRAVMRALVDGRDDVRFHLSSADGLADWYATLGFERDPRAMVRRRVERTRPDTGRSG